MATTQGVCARCAHELDLVDGVCISCKARLVAIAREQYGTWREWRRVLGAMYLTTPLARR